LVLTGDEMDFRQRVRRFPTDCDELREVRDGLQAPVIGDVLSAAGSSAFINEKSRQKKGDTA
jgi:hypothetical protein